MLDTLIILLETGFVIIIILKLNLANLANLSQINHDWTKIFQSVKGLQGKSFSANLFESCTGDDKN